MQVPPSSRSQDIAQRPHVIQPRRIRPLQMLWVGGLIIALFLWALYRRPPPPASADAVQMNGLTMGTTWTIRIADSHVRPGDLPDLRAAVETAFAEINRQMSTYDPTSEISQFNDGPAGVEWPVSPEFARVVRFALNLAEMSDGAFDPTVGPLTELWGFGRLPRGEQPPTDAEIAEAMDAVGYRKVTLTEDGRLSKSHDRLRLDLNAVAKGYGVDVAAQVLWARGLRNFYVEVGGEVVARGERPGGGPWRIGVERPQAGTPPGAAIERVLHVADFAVATSGDYRNFRRDDGTGEAYAHIFDPRIGRPVRRTAGSVTVIAEDCLKADGLATALYVMGPDEGLAWLGRNCPETDALFIVRRPDGSLEQRTTAEFDARTRP